MNSFTYFIPTKVLFGAGKLNELGTMKLPGKKALIVITAGKSMRSNGYLERVQALLSKNNCANVVFDKILPNPILSHVMEGATLAKQEKCDFVIGLGGGSSIDSAKSIAVMAKNSGNYWDYVSGGSGKGLPISNGALPIIAITTTAGTGTEADPWTVITNEEKKEKIGFGCDATFPAVSIVDPELMTTVPSHLTAFQGFDAFFHAAEGYLANIATPISDAFALQSIALIAKSLPTAVKDGGNLKARTDIALANTLSGMVESTSCCISEHSIAHALGAHHQNLPHGAALISVSEEYFRFFETKVPERFAKMAEVMGTKNASPADFVKNLVQLQKECNVFPLKLSDYGVTEAELPTIADNAKDTMGGLFVLDPVQLTRDDVIGILKRSYR